MVAMAVAKVVAITEIMVLAIAVVAIAVVAVAVASLSEFILAVLTCDFALMLMYYHQCWRPTDFLSACKYTCR